MVRKEDKMCIRAMLTSAITALCKTKLGFKNAVNIEGLLGITIDKDDIFLVNINECISKLPDQGEENNNGGNIPMSGDVHRDVAYNSNLEGVTGEKIEAVLVKNKEDDRDLARVSAVIQGGLENIKSVSTAAAIMATGKVGEKYAKSMDSQSSTDPSEYESYDSNPQGKGNSAEPMVGCSSWNQSTESGTTVSQAMAVTSPLVAASISQMSGIAQTTQEWFLRENMRISAQLEDQRRKSRDHMRRYRQQLRESNYSEYEERKRRQREGMRRYRERLRIENPEKYAEMNRKHAEQERRRRLRARSLSESHLKTQQSSNIMMRSGQQSESRQKLAPPDFLHMAMETSQLFQARDMHQLLQAGLPVSSNSLAMVTGALGTVGINPGNAVGVTPNSVTITGPLALTGVAQVAVEDVQQGQPQLQQQQQPQPQQQPQQQQQQQQQPQPEPQHQTVTFSEAQQQATTTTTTQQQQQMIDEHIHRMGATTPNQALTIQQASRQPHTPTERTTTVTLAPIAQMPQTLSTVS